MRRKKSEGLSVYHPRNIFIHLTLGMSFLFPLLTIYFGKYQAPKYERHFAKLATINYLCF